MILLGLLAGIPVGAIFVLIFILFGNDEAYENHRPLSTKFTFLGLVIDAVAFSSFFWLTYGSVWAWCFLGSAGWVVVLLAITGIWNELKYDTETVWGMWLCGLATWITGGWYLISVWTDLVRSLSNLV